MPLIEQSVVEGWRGVLVTVGLASPMKRGLTAVLLSGALLYTLKYPRTAFREDGSIRPATFQSRAADATDTHFLLTPLAIGGAVCLFT